MLLDSDLASALCSLYGQQPRDLPLFLEPFLSHSKSISCCKPLLRLQAEEPSPGATVKKRRTATNKLCDYNNNISILEI